MSRETVSREQPRGPDCQNYTTFVPTFDSNITDDSEQYLVSIARLDGGLQKIEARNLRKLVLFIAYYSRFRGHPGVIQVFNSMTREF